MGGGLFREVNRETVEPPNCILSFVERLFCIVCTVCPLLGGLSSFGLFHCSFFREVNREVVSLGR